MRYFRPFYAAAAFLAIVALAMPAFSQDKEEPVTKTETLVTESAVTETAVQSSPIAKEESTPPLKEISIYGEVEDVNIPLDTLSVQYYNYDNDEEKSIEIVVSKSTKMENADGLKDVKKGDWVDVVYIVIGGKNVASSIVVEKEEEAIPEEPLPTPGQKPTEVPDEY